MAVVHVHHGIRADAGEDAAYVRELCSRLELPFFQENADVPKLAQETGISEEEAGRKARYEAFEKYAAIWSAQLSEEGRGAQEICPGERSVRIALAHHMGDQAETVLFHLFRGSGSRGLAGICPVREHRMKEPAEESSGQNVGSMTVIRPLLCLERSEIEDYLKEADLVYCQDSTNREDAYARNRIRHHILPYAEAEICSGAARHIAQTALQISEIEEYLTVQTAAARKLCAKGYEIAAEAFLKLPLLIQKRLLMEMLLELSPCHKDIGAVHIDALLGLFAKETGKSLSLPQGIRAKRVYERVILERETQAQVCPEVFLPGDLQEGERAKIAFGESFFVFQILKNNKFLKIPENQYTKWFDYGKIKGTLSVRSRKTGDYLTIRGGEGETVRKKVREYMITEKIPRERRESLPLLAERDHILWIPGYRISEAYKVGSNTEYILQAEFLKNGG